MRGLLARGLDALGRRDEAEEHLRAGLGSDSGDADKIDRMGLLTYNQQRYDKCEEWFERLVGLSPQNAQGIANLAAAVCFAGKREEAIESFDRALELDPHSRASLTGLAQIQAAGRGSGQ